MEHDFDGEDEGNRGCNLGCIAVSIILAASTVYGIFETVAELLGQFH